MRDLFMNYKATLFFAVIYIGLTPIMAADRGIEASKPPKVDIKNPAIKAPERLSPEQAKQLRKELLKTKIKRGAYNQKLKNHHITVASENLVRKPIKERARTNIRSQNTQWRGTYDCNDNDAAVKPNQVEVCDGIDNNCNGDVDEGVTADLYLDADGDGWGDPNQPIKACHIESGYASRGSDCDDGNIQVYPGASDREGDGIDANCDGKDG